ncbi:MAG: four-helix bundle copper-binding protein [Candidatus Bathyarchaeota archaeon]|nr:four-helix bundle copper-binding protein [Candidatus Bathyarchaeota archaeon]
MSQEVKECIQDCVDCFRICTETSVKCLKMTGKHAELEHVNLILDCARICNLNADFMLRNSSYYPQTCSITADICDECADTCDRFEDDFMKDCASVCRRCAESCREMAK